MKYQKSTSKCKKNDYLVPVIIYVPKVGVCRSLKIATQHVYSVRFTSWVIAESTILLGGYSMLVPHASVYQFESVLLHICKWNWCSG